jgi:hypothetical protein
MPTVRNRCVFYVSGFDPKGAAHYHALYRDEAAKQALAGGVEVEVGPRKRLPNGDSFWEVRAEDGGTEVQTRYVFLHWDDIVRAHWPRRQVEVWRDIVATTLHNVRTGALWKMAKLSKPAGTALTLPVAMLALGFVIGPLLGLAAGLALRAASASLSAAFGAGLACIALAAALARFMESRYSMYWMMRSYAFTRLHARGVPALEARLDAMAESIAGRIAAAEDDEVLVVGHSSGPILAVQALSRALHLLQERNAPRGQRPVVSLLTLGQCIPILGLLPEASRFREELASLAASPRLAHWIDFSAPPDGCCFALTDPLTACEVASEPVPDRPKLLSPRFAQLFEPANYAKLRRDKFNLHFQYLKSAERMGDYDYFRITAGAKTLGERYAAFESVADYADLRLFAPS